MGKTLGVSLWCSAHLCEKYLIITQSITEESQRVTKKLLCNQKIFFYLHKCHLLIIFFQPLIRIIYLTYK